MDDNSVEFRKVPIRPVECLKEAKNQLGEQYWLFVGICAVGILIGSLVPMGLLMGPMMCGIYLCFFKRSRGETVTFELLFKGFDYFIESLIASLIMVAAITAVLIPMYLIMYVLIFAGMFAAGAAEGGGQGGDFAMAGFLGMMAFFYLVIFVAIIAVGTFFSFVYPLIVDRNMKAWPALKTSFSAVWANFGGMLGLVLLSQLILGVAAMCCYLPALLVLPITIGANKLAYFKVFPEAPEPEYESHTTELQPE